MALGTQSLAYVILCKQFITKLCVHLCSLNFYLHLPPSAFCVAGIISESLLSYFGCLHFIYVYNQLKKTRRQKHYYLPGKYFLLRDSFFLASKAGNLPGMVQFEDQDYSHSALKYGLSKVLHMSQHTDIEFPHSGANKRTWLASMYKKEQVVFFSVCVWAKKIDLNI